MKNKCEEISHSDRGTIVVCLCNSKVWEKLLSLLTRVLFTKCEMLSISFGFSHILNISVISRCVWC